MAEEKRKVVRYKHAHTFVNRVIGPKDWEAVGANGQSAVTWDQTNNWEVPVDQFSSEALEYFKMDPDFRIVEV